jgi:hypothetical protein
MLGVLMDVEDKCNSECALSGFYSIPSSKLIRLIHVASQTRQRRRINSSGSGKPKCYLHRVSLTPAVVSTILESTCTYIPNYPLLEPRKTSAAISESEKQSMSTSSHTINSIVAPPPAPGKMWKTAHVTNAPVFISLQMLFPSFLRIKTSYDMRRYTSSTNYRDHLASSLYQLPSSPTAAHYSLPC